VKEYFDPDLIVPNKDLSLREGAILPWSEKNPTSLLPLLEALVDRYKIDIRKPFREIPKEVQDVILFGSNGEEIEFKFDLGSRRQILRRPYEGVIGELKRAYEEADFYEKERLERYINLVPCPGCGGARLRKEMLFVRVGGKNIYEVTEMSVRACYEFVTGLHLSEKEREISKMVLKEITSRLKFLIDVGLDYITLNRNSSTLSSGEAQRIRLATQIGSGLTGVLYVLDEPSIGLHVRDTERLLRTLKGLRDLGNTVIVVEHDFDTIASADYVVDLGPGAGENGGYLVFQGTVEDLKRHSESLTGKYLSKRFFIEVPKERRVPKGFLVLRGARANNLKGIDVEIPLGVFVVVTGVSGSGKSTLIVDTLLPLLRQKLYRSKEKAGQADGISGYEAIDKVIEIDQSPIGRTPRSNPATYTGLFTPIRELFAKLPESRIRGYKEGRFSFNVKGGRCETCQGEGYVKIEMQFLPDVFITCDACKGKRYNRDTLEVRYKGKNIADVLEMTVSQALQFFDPIPSIREKLKVLDDVGLGYMRLGQPATTLSGGEAQRIKLAKELSRRETGRTLYILDEPTTGLHFVDIEKLIKVLFALVDRGNTVIVIEHNMDVIKCADYVIDLGPEGGENGGYLVAKGRPEEVAQVRESYTGRFLKRYLDHIDGSSLRKTA